MYSADTCSADTCSADTQDWSNSDWSLAKDSKPREPDRTAGGSRRIAADKLGKPVDKLGKPVDKLGKLVATGAARVDQRWLLGRRVCCKGSVG